MVPFEAGHVGVVAVGELEVDVVVPLVTRDDVPLELDEEEAADEELLEDAVSELEDKDRDVELLLIDVAEVVSVDELEVDKLDIVDDDIELVVLRPVRRYKVNPLLPPQISFELPAHVILHLPSVAA